MDSSSAAYSNEQLGSIWLPSQVSRQSGRILPSSRSTRSIGNLTGHDHAYMTGNAASSGKPVELLSSFATAQVSIGSAGVDDYLEGLLNDSEIEQIRSENKSILSSLLSLYVFEDETSVRSFLEDHPSVTNLLLEAVPFLRESFGDGVILQLQIPPDEDLPLTIYAVALWEGALEGARAALRKFDDAWWTANGHRALGRIVIDYQLI